MTDWSHNQYLVDVHQQLQSFAKIPGLDSLQVLSATVTQINEPWQRFLAETERLQASLQRLTESFTGNWSLPPVDDRIVLVCKPLGPEEHALAAERIADTRFKRPLSARRWQIYGYRIRAACEERAANDAIHTDGSWWTVFRRVTVEAIRLTALEVNVHRASIMVTVDGKRWTVREDRDITAWEVVGELPVSFFFNWFRKTVANEVMDNLLPNWRSEEQRSREKVQFVSLDALISRVTRQFSEGRNNEESTGLFDALIAQDATTEGGRDALIAQDREKSLLDRLPPLLTPSEYLVYEACRNGSRTFESVAQSLGKDRSTVSRQIKSIAEKARRLGDADLSA